MSRGQWINKGSQWKPKAGYSLGRFHFKRQRRCKHEFPLPPRGSRRTCYRARNRPDPVAAPRPRGLAYLQHQSPSSQNIRVGAGRAGGLLCASTLIQNHLHTRNNSSYRRNYPRNTFTSTHELLNAYLCRFRIPRLAFSLIYFLPHRETWYILHTSSLEDIIDVHAMYRWKPCRYPHSCTLRSSIRNGAQAVAVDKKFLNTVRL